MIKVMPQEIFSLQVNTHAMGKKPLAFIQPGAQS